MAQMEDVNLNKNLNDFFYEYVYNNLIVTIVTDNIYFINIELFHLKHEFIKKYSYPELMTYIMEILIQLLKDDYDLSLMNVNFYKEAFGKPERYNFVNFPYPTII